MSLTLHTALRKVLVVSIIACAALFIFSLLAPRAHAAAVTISAATTTTNNASTTLAKVDDTVIIGLSLSGAPAATNTPKINIFNMGTTTMTNTSGNIWQYSTTSASSWTNGYVSWYVAWSGTLGEATSTFATSSLTSANVRFDKTAPSISTITSSATCTGTGSVCKVGDTIAFTLTPGATEYGGTISGSYNSTALSWSTADVGATFTGTYTVVEGETDQTTAVQISSVVLTDAAGNAGTAGAGTDITATIDANTPGTPTSNVGPGTYDSDQRIVLASTGSNTIYYTTNGTTPSCSSGTAYSSSFTIAATVKAIGCDTAGNASAVSTFTYTVSSATNSSTGGGGGGGYVGANKPVTPAPASGKMTESQIQSILSLLTSFGADQAVIDTVNASLHGQKTSPMPGIAPIVALTKNLSVGATGEDVKALQVFLNTHGFMVSSSGPGSSGNETTTFGSRTRAALAAFQKSKGITPAVGFFGPKTQAAVNAEGGM